MKFFVLSFLTVLMLSIVSCDDKTDLPSVKDNCASTNSTEEITWLKEVKEAYLVSDNTSGEIKYLT